jgi:hypothetical protein
VNFFWEDKKKPSSVRRSLTGYRKKFSPSMFGKEKGWRWRSRRSSSG